MKRGEVPMFSMGHTAGRLRPEFALMPFAARMEAEHQRRVIITYNFMNIGRMARRTAPLVRHEPTRKFGQFVDVPDGV